MVEWFEGRRRSTVPRTVCMNPPRRRSRVGSIAKATPDGEVPCRALQLQQGGRRSHHPDKPDIPSIGQTHDLTPGGFPGRLNLERLMA